MVNHKVIAIMQTSLIHCNDDLLSELEDLAKELAWKERFPAGECTLCGSSDEVSPIVVTSDQLYGPTHIPVCFDCRKKMKGQDIDDHLRMIKKDDNFLWGKIVSHNIRKLNWISRLAFLILGEDRIERI